MTKRRRVLIALSFGISAALALVVWLLGFESAANAVGLVTAAIGAISWLLSRLAPKPSANDDAKSGRAGVAKPSTTPRRRRALLVAASLAPVVAVAAGVLLVWQLGDGGRSDPNRARQATPSARPVAPPAGGPGGSGQPDGSSGSAGPGTPGPSNGPSNGPTPVITPIVDPMPPTRPPTGRPTTPPIQSPKPAQPWIPPAGTPEWTLYDTDGVRFLPTPSRRSAEGHPEMTFQFEPYRQMNWYQWTDSTDLSYQGCRSASAARWDSLKLEDFTTPRTYCRREPGDPSKVAYVQFTAKDMTADPPYVKVRVWVYSP